MPWVVSHPGQVHILLVFYLYGVLYALANFGLTKSKGYAAFACIVTLLALAFGQLYSVQAPDGMGGLLAMIMGSIFVLLNPANVTSRRIGGWMLLFAALALVSVILEGWEALTWFPRYGGLTAALLMSGGGIFSIVHNGRS